jgi:hypothetical protein
LNAIKTGFQNSDKKKEETYKLANEAFKFDINDLKTRLSGKKEKKIKSTTEYDDVYNTTNNKQPEPQPKTPQIEETETNETTTTTLDDLLTIT